MRTRTLLLLAVGCGVLILVAGVVQLLRLAAQDEPAAAFVVGDPVRLGDLVVTVEELTETNDRVDVLVQIGGVDDPAAIEEFRLIVPGHSLRPTSQPDARLCTGSTRAVNSCTIAFELPDDAGSSRVLLYRRGDERARWDLTDG